MYDIHFLNLAEQFIKYAKINTTSDENSPTCPSTPGQIVLGNLLVEELKALEISDVVMDENGYIFATIPANTDKILPTIGFIAHLDTAPDYTAHNVNPHIVYNYDGSDIVLNDALNIISSPKDFSSLKNYIGQDLIVTDGTTLLGADDKSGITAIMGATAYMLRHPEFKHGTIRIAFNPDEEIARGADKFDVPRFGADFAYTVDGGELGELEYENFNAANAKITINGRNVHPGYAKNAMINSIDIASELHQLLPEGQKPQFTTRYEGFFHLNSIHGSVEVTKLVYLVRDHNRAKFETRKTLLENAVNFLNLKYGSGTVEIDMKDSYFNMREQIEPVMHIVDTAKQALLDLEIQPIVKPIRGGTDGSRLSFMGLPCPNLFTGGHNFHGKHEYISVQSLEKSVQNILRIIELYTTK